MNDNFPETVNFYPLMAIQAARKSSRLGGGYRLLVLAKSLDQAGRGAVSRDALREYALSLGVSPRQWLRWITEARNHDFMQDVQRQNGEWELILSSISAAAFSMNCETVGNRKVSMPASCLVGPGWKARIWAAYETTFNEKPISREQMQKIVNVPVSTQRYRDAQAGVIRTANYAKLKNKADELPMLKEYGQHKGLYLRKDGTIGSRKPDSRSAEFAERGRKGRARKANATLHRMQQQNGLSLMRRALRNEVNPDPATNHSVYVRLFNFTPDEARASEKKLAKLDTRQDVYEFSHAAKSGAGVWLQC